MLSEQEKELISSINPTRYNTNSKTVLFGNLFPDWNNRFVDNWSTCKEFVLDNTYNFCKNSTQELKETTLVVSVDYENSIELIKKLIHQFEDYLGWEHSNIFEFGKFIIIKGSVKWSLASPILSFYASLVRLAVHLESVDGIINQVTNKQAKVNYPKFTYGASTDPFILNHNYFISFLNMVKNHSEFIGKFKDNWLKVPYGAVHSLGILNFLNTPCLKCHNNFLKKEIDFVK